MAMMDVCPKCGCIRLAENEKGGYKCLNSDCGWASWFRFSEVGDVPAIEQNVDLYPLNKQYGALLSEKKSITKRLESIEKEMKQIQNLYKKMGNKANE